MSLRSYRLLSSLAQQEHFPSQTSTSMEVNRRSITNPHESHLLESISVPIRHTRPYNHNRHGTWIISRCSGVIQCIPYHPVTSPHSHLFYLVHQKHFRGSWISKVSLVHLPCIRISFTCFYGGQVDTNGGLHIWGCMDGAKWSVSVGMLEYWNVRNLDMWMSAIHSGWEGARLLIG